MTAAWPLLRRAAVAGSFWLTLLAVGCLTAGMARAADAADSAIQAPGDQRHSLVHGGLRRSYRVVLPRSVDATRPAPLLLALHGGGGDMNLQADDSRYGLISKAESAGFIVVFPNGFSRFPGGRLATWNAGQCCGDARDRQVDDVGFLRAVVAAVQRQYKVDATRVYATGMSNGGMMVHRLACEAADVFTAVAAVAGTDNTTQCQPSRAIPVLQIHARNDSHVLFEGGAGPDAFRDRSKVTEFTPVPETLRRWTERNQCSRAPVTVLDRPGARCERTAGCRDGVAVQLCVTDTGGHSWPGAEVSRRGKEAPSQALSANDAMWDFFNGR